MFAPKSANLTIILIFILFIRKSIAVATPLMSFSIPGFDAPHTVKKIVGTKTKYLVGYYAHTEGVILDYDPLKAPDQARLVTVNTNGIS